MASNNGTEPGGWQVGKSLTDCLRHMLDNHVACDVTFAVQSTGNPHVTIPAHKLILQARSPVFEAMFSGAFLEAGGDVVITDMDPDPFQDLLRYIYTDDIQLNGNNVIPLLYAGEKYMLRNLTEKCKQFLEKEISVDNACSFLTHSLIQQDEELVNKCLDLIAPNAKAVVKTESFYEMSHDALLKVVGYDHLAHGVETELFEACIEWGKRRTKDPENATGEEIRNILTTECLHSIRFPHVSLKTFASKFGHTTVLNEQEKNMIYPLLITGSKSCSKALSELGFDISSRIFRASRYQHDYGEQYGCDLRSEAKSMEKFNFSVNRPIHLRGFSIHGGEKGSKHDVKIIIHSPDEDDPCAKVEHTIVAKEDFKPIPVYCRKILLTANTEYQVAVTVKGTEKTGWSWEPIAKIEEDGVAITSTPIKYPLHNSSQGGAKAGFVAEFLFQLLPATKE